MPGRLTCRPSLAGEWLGPLLMRALRHQVVPFHAQYRPLNTEFAILDVPRSIIALACAPQAFGVSHFRDPQRQAFDDGKAGAVEIDDHCGRGDMRHGNLQRPGMFFAGLLRRVAALRAPPDVSIGAVSCRLAPALAGLVS